jgi:outer membrane protein insertion porin family
VQADVSRVVELYRRSGRFDVQVTPKVIELPNNRVDLVFEIKENGKTGIKDINFVGNHAYSSYRLRDIIKSSESNLFSFLQTSDIYDPDRLEADRDLLRRFYLKRGYADVRITSVNSVYDPAKKGFVITFNIDEGAFYRFGTVNVQSNVRNVDPALLRAKLRMSAGDTYNAEAVEKTVEDMTIEAAKRGYAFATVRPRGERDYANHKVNLTFVVEEGPRVYIERINIVGNTRTRDYVIRREFDIAEGDAYNRALVDRAERRLKNLNYFKSVKITNEPGSAPDRVVLNVAVEEMSTGEFSIAGGYSTADGFIGEVSVAERNLLGRGYYGKVGVTYGQYARGGEISFVDPYFLDYRLALGVDVFAKQQLATSYVSYDTNTAGGALRLDFALTENWGLQLRYSGYSQEIKIPDLLVGCTSATYGCPSLPARIELNQGPVFTSLLGYSISYNTLDNNKNPTNGIYGELKEDFAGVGGDIQFLRSSVDARYYHELFGDLIGVVRGQAGHIMGWGGSGLRMLDHFQMGPNLVRGFAPSGIGPRDLTPNSFNDALGGSLYWGASVEAQMPLYFLPKEVGIRLAAFADAGSLWDYKGPVASPTTTEVLSCIPGTGNKVVATPNGPACYGDSNLVRSSVGIGLIWDSPFGPIRFDYAFPLTRESYDRVQQFRFSGGTKF